MSSKLNNKPIRLLWILSFSQLSLTALPILLRQANCSKKRMRGGGKLN